MARSLCGAQSLKALNCIMTGTRTICLAPAQVPSHLCAGIFICLGGWCKWSAENHLGTCANIRRKHTSSLIHHHSQTQQTLAWLPSTNNAVYMDGILLHWGPTDLDYTKKERTQKHIALFSIFFLRFFFLHIEHCAFV